MCRYPRGISPGSAFTFSTVAITLEVLHTKLSFISDWAEQQQPIEFRKHSLVILFIGLFMTTSSFFRVSSEINDQGVASLHEGNATQAIVLLDSALLHVHAHQLEVTARHLRREAYQTVNTESTEDQNERQHLCCASCPTWTTPRPLAVTKGGSDNMVSGIYCRGVLFRELFKSPDFEEGNVSEGCGHRPIVVTYEDSMMCFTVVLFNLALAYHIQAMNESNAVRQRSDLVIARSMYDMVYSNLIAIDNHRLTPHPPSSGAEKSVAVGRRHVVDIICMGVLNNLMQISTEFYNYEETTDIVNRLTLYVISALHTVDEGAEHENGAGESVSSRKTRKNAVLMSFLNNASATLTLLKQAAPAA